VIAKLEKALAVIAASGVLYYCGVAIGAYLA
jgi:hypothetical protein